MPIWFGLSGVSGSGGCHSLFRETVAPAFVTAGLVGSATLWVGGGWLVGAVGWHASFAWVGYDNHPTPTHLLLFEVPISCA